MIKLVLIDDTSNDFKKNDKSLNIEAWFIVPHNFSVEDEKSWQVILLDKSTFVWLSFKDGEISIGIYQ